jgi:hypothetical protein
LYLHGGVQHRVNRGDALQMRRDQLARRNLAFPHQASLPASGEIQDLSHVLFSRIAAIPQCWHTVM